MTEENKPIELEDDALENVSGGTGDMDGKPANYFPETHKCNLGRTWRKRTQYPQQQCWNCIYFTGDESVNRDYGWCSEQ